MLKATHEAPCERRKEKKISMISDLLPDLSHEITKVLLLESLVLAC